MEIDFLLSYFLTDLGVREEEEDWLEAELRVQFGAIWPVCWQLKQTICLSDLGNPDRRLAEKVEEEGIPEEEVRFLAEDLEAALLTSVTALAICFRSPVSCWNKIKNKKGGW